MNDTPDRGMTEQDFGNLLDRHGGDSARWPPELARAAERLLADSSVARRELAAAQTLDGWLSDRREHRAPAGIAAGVLSRVGGTEAPRRRTPDPFDRMFDWLTARLWRPILIGALPVLAGLVIGLATPEPDDADLANQIGSLAFVDLYAEVHDADQP